MFSKHLIIRHSLLLLPSVFHSIMVFSNESTLYITWPKYWNFSFSISSSNEYSGLISFRIDWFDLIPVHGTLMSLLQHHNSKESILQCLAFLMVQHSQQTWQQENPWLWVYRPLFAKWCLCFWIHCLVCSRFSSKGQASFDFMAAHTICSDFGVQESKICHSFHFFPLFVMEWWNWGHDLRFLNVEF